MTKLKVAAEFDTAALDGAAVDGAAATSGVGQAAADTNTPPAKLEHFIPLRKAELIDRLCRQPGLSPADQDGFRRLCQLLDATLHFEYHAHLEDLKSAYAPFDPDADTQNETVLSEHRSPIAAGLALRAVFLAAGAGQFLPAIRGPTWKKPWPPPAIMD